MIGDDDFGVERNRTIQEMVQTLPQLEAKFFKFIPSNGPRSRLMSEKNCFFVSSASSLNPALQRSNLLRRFHGFQTIDRGFNSSSLCNFTFSLAADQSDRWSCRSDMLNLYGNFPSGDNEMSDEMREQFGWP
jgi:hypothetical protein